MMKLNKLALVLILSIWKCFFFTSVVSGGDATAGPDRIRIGYSSISGGRIMLWAAHERGFFAKEGLQSELIIISGVQGLQALVSRDIQFFLGPTDSAAVLASRGGPGLVLLAFQEPTPYKLLVQPAIRTAKDLKGKKVVIDRIGGSSYHISLRLLEKIGLKAEDVEFIQVGGGGTQRVAAFKSGMVSAVVTSPERFEELKIPYFPLADAGESGIKIVGNSLMTTRSFRDRQRDIVQRTVRAIVHARHWMKNAANRESVLQIYRRYLRNDDLSALELTYRTHIEPAAVFPYGSTEDLSEYLSYLPDGNQLLQKLNISELVDNSFIKRVAQEGSQP